jgi:hypothetical protein
MQVAQGAEGNQKLFSNANGVFNSSRWTQTAPHLAFQSGIA